jgi:hypothetical protein
MVASKYQPIGLNGIERDGVGGRGEPRGNGASSGEKKARNNQYPKTGNPNLKSRI